VESEQTPAGLPAVRAGQTELSAPETRVLGCLLEKQRTTPDQYPLTLNALRLACNQSTNREPVVDYDDALIREALHRLERRGFVRLASGRGSRAPKYRHLLADALPMRDDEQAVMCVLMLRGAQTPGELKQRADRMHAFADLGAVAQALERLVARGLVRRLDRRPGQKEERFSELLTGDAAHAGARAADGAGTGASAPDAVTPSGADAVTQSAAAGAEDTTAPGVSIEEFEELRARVERLEQQLAALNGARAAEPAEPAEWART
jgi:uncharacterized protein